MHTIEGKYGIKATVLLCSVSANTGVEMVTFEIEYPRLILAELNTHRMLSRNSASSRAIPFQKMMDQLTARPVRFGQARPGMQDNGVDFDAPVVYNCFADGEPWFAPHDAAWEFAKRDAVKHAKSFYEAGYHKQVYNRLIEPFQMMKTVISGTEWSNFFWLRNHEAADPTIAELARVMKEAYEAADVQALYPGEWHLPYLDTCVLPHEAVLSYGDWVDGEFIKYSLDDAIKVSCARCAAVSFRNVDYGLEKSKEVYERLLGDERKHASAFEHCATPMVRKYADAEAWALTNGNINACNIPDIPETWENGVSHMDRQSQLWSGNLRGWIQFRKLIPGENYTEY